MTKMLIEDTKMLSFLCSSARNNINIAQLKHNYTYPFVREAPITDHILGQIWQFKWEGQKGAVENLTSELWKKI